MTSWYCNICDKTVNIQSKPKHPICNSLKHKEKNIVVAKECVFFKSDNDKIVYIINNCASDCYNKNFQRFKFSCFYDIVMTDGD